MDSPSSAETPAIPAHGTDTLSNGPHMHHRRGAAAFRGVIFTRHYVTRTIQDVIKPAIKTFLETCDTNPRIAAVVATPALLGFLLLFVFLGISTLVLVVWTIITISVGIIFVIIGGIVSFFFKLLFVVLATIPLAGIAIALLVGANSVSQSIISRMPQNDAGTVITQTVQDIDWKSVVEQLINLAKRFRRSTAVWEGLVVFKAAVHNSFGAFIIGVSEDLRNARAERFRSDPPSSSTAERSTGEPSRGNSNGVHQTQSVFEYNDSELRDVQPPASGSTEGLNRRAPFPQTSEDEEVLGGA